MLVNPSIKKLHALSSLPASVMIHFICLEIQSSGVESWNWSGKITLSRAVLMTRLTPLFISLQPAQAFILAKPKCFREALLSRDVLLSTWSAKVNVIEHSIFWQQQHQNGIDHLMPSAIVLRNGVVVMLFRFQDLESWSCQIIAIINGFANSSRGRKHTCSTWFKRVFRHLKPFTRSMHELNEFQFRKVVVVDGPFVL